jgi:hypothetical protein
MGNKAGVYLVYFALVVEQTRSLWCGQVENIVRSANKPRGVCNSGTCDVSSVSNWNVSNTLHTFSHHTKDNDAGDCDDDKTDATQGIKSVKASLGGDYNQDFAAENKDALVKQNFKKYRWQERRKMRGKENRNKLR